MFSVIQFKRNQCKFLTAFYFKIFSILYAKNQCIISIYYFSPPVYIYFMPKCGDFGKCVCTQNQISSRTLKIACKIPTVNRKKKPKIKKIAMNIEERSEFSLAVDRRHWHGLHNEIKNPRILISA